MTARVLCPALDAMLKKTIIALCEVNIQYNLCLEISGSLHIRADGERVFNCLIEEELNGKEKKTRKDSLNDIAGFSIDLAKLHRDSMDSFTEREEEYEGDELDPVAPDLTSEDEATLAEVHHSETLEVSSASSSQYSKSPASATADGASATMSDLEPISSSNTSNTISHTLPVASAKPNLAAIFPTPKTEPSCLQSAMPVSTHTTSSAAVPDFNQNQPLISPPTCNLAAVATTNPNLNLQAVAIAAAIQRAAEASKKNIGMVLPTQSAPASTMQAATSTAPAVDSHTNALQDTIPPIAIKVRLQKCCG